MRHSVLGNRLFLPSDSGTLQNCKHSSTVPVCNIKFSDPGGGNRSVGQVRMMSSFASKKEISRAQDLNRNCRREIPTCLDQASQSVPLSPGLYHSHLATRPFKPTHATSSVPKSSTWRLRSRNWPLRVLIPASSRNNDPRNPFLDQTLNASTATASDLGTKGQALRDKRALSPKAKTVYGMH